MIKSLKDARITDGLPRIVSGQDWVIALSEALGKLHEKTLEYADNSQIYTALDTVPEQILDILAVNWKIDWYDTGFSVDQKRRIVKACIESRRVMGTVKAVRLQAQAIYPGTDIREWFEIGSEPGTFDLDLHTLPTGADLKQFLNAINYTKNVRSHLRQMKVYLTGDIDGPDVMDGRPDKDPYGVETHYFVSYFGYMSSEDLQRLDLSRIRFDTAIPFWGGIFYNGEICYDGSALYKLYRRYNLALVMRDHLGEFVNDNSIDLSKVRTHSKWINRERMKARQQYRAVLDFWQIYHYEGAIRYNGDKIYDQNRGALRLALKLLTGESQSEQIGEATVTTKTHNVYFYNGEYRHNGQARYKTKYKKEVIL